MTTTEALARHELATLQRALRDHGLHATYVRIIVLRVLRASEMPLSPGEIISRAPELRHQRRTVYSSLRDLLGAGLVRQTPGPPRGRLFAARPVWPGVTRRRR